MTAKSRTQRLQIVTPEEELENLRNEVGVLKRAVESKSAAVGILRSELQECQRERDKFRTMAEQGTVRRPSSTMAKASYSDPGRSAMLSGSEGTLAQLLSQSKEENKMLRHDVTELRCKLHDAQADIKVLREESQRLRGCEGRRRSIAHTATSQLAHQEREQFITQMEALSARCQALEGDVRGLVEEREELVRELDSATHKLHRLNHILNTILSAASSAVPSAPKRVIDLDAIITENKYLQQRLKQTEEERNLARTNGSKYKAALEKCRSHGSVKLGTEKNLIVTPKQVGEMLHEYRGEVGGAEENDLKSLCVALVDALNQRSRALRTQRSANKVLIGRVTELERRLSSGGDTGNETTDRAEDDLTLPPDAPTPQLASLSLMDGYVHPSGPVPKYCEDEVLQDPRVGRLLHRRTGDVEENGENKNNVEERMNDSSTDTEGQAGNKLTKGVISNSENNPSESVPDAAVGECASTSVNDKELKNEENITSVKGRVGDVTSTSDVNHKEHKKSEEKKTSEKERVMKNVSSQVSAEMSDEKDSICNENPNTTKGKVGDTSGHLQNQTGAKAENASDKGGHKANKDSKVKTFVNPKDDLEEIVPLDQLDLYIKEVQLQRKQANTPCVTTNETSVEPGNKPNEVKELKESEKKLKDKVKIEDGGGKLRKRGPSGKETKNTVRLRERKEIITDTIEEREEEEEEREEEEEAGEDEEEEEEVINEANEEEEGKEDRDSFDLDISDYDSDNDNLDAALEDWQKEFAGKGSSGKTKDKNKSKQSPSKEAKETFSLWRKNNNSNDLPPALKKLLDQTDAAFGTDCS